MLCRGLAADWSKVQKSPQVRSMVRSELRTRSCSAFSPFIQPAPRFPLLFSAAEVLEHVELVLSRERAVVVVDLVS